MTNDEKIVSVLAQIQDTLFALTEYIDKASIRVSGVEAHSESVAKSLDEDAEDTLAEKIVEKQKGLIAHIFDNSKTYTTVVIFGFYGAFFVLWAGTKSIIDSENAALSALLILISISVFAGFEVFNMIKNSIQFLKAETIEQLTLPKSYIGLWAITVAVAVATALAAILIQSTAYWQILYPPT